MWLTRYAYLLRILFIGVLGFLTYLLLIELAPATHTVPYWDKFQHIIAFGGVTAAGIFAFQRLPLKVCVALSVYGALMEMLQGFFTSSRKPSVLDWLADNVGIVLAGYLCYRLLLRLHSRHG